MPRIAILGGGLAGLAAAFECQLHGLDWHLYEASPCLGGTVATTRRVTPDGEYLLEDGPDGWLTEKPWLAELAEELYLHPEVIPCNEAERRTLLSLNGQLVPMPARMRLMVPEDLRALEDSPLFTAEARAAYARELASAEPLREAAPDHDESVASFVRRHFGAEVLAKVAAPLLSGVFGGDVERLSVRAVMPQFVRMEREAGSLIASLSARARMRDADAAHAALPGESQHSPAHSLSAHAEPARQPTFTTLQNGMGSLIDALVAALPAERLHTRHAAAELRRTPAGWLVRFTGTGVNACLAGMVPFDHLLLATPLDSTRNLLRPLDPEAASLLPTEASSALLVTLGWPPETAATFSLPQGFGFLVPYTEGQQASLLAASFAHQKYPSRAPAGAKVIRAFFGDHGSAALLHADDATAIAAALTQLRALLGSLPDPDPTLTTVRRWPRSLPQYEVGHLDRMSVLQDRAAKLGALHLLGNSYHGVGLPDLIRDARAAARSLHNP